MCTPSSAHFESLQYRRKTQGHCDAANASVLAFLSARDTCRRDPRLVRRHARVLATSTALVHTQRQLPLHPTSVVGRDRQVLLRCTTVQLLLVELADNTLHGSSRLFHFLCKCLPSTTDLLRGESKGTWRPRLANLFSSITTHSLTNHPTYLIL